MSIRNFGIHVVSTAEDQGMTLGLSEKLYVFMKRAPLAATLPSAATMPSATEIARGCGEVPVQIPNDARPALGEMGSPVLVAEKSSGIILHTSDSRHGIGIGLDSWRAVILPKSFKGVAIVTGDGTMRPQNVRAYLKEAQ